MLRAWPNQLVREDHLGLPRNLNSGRGSVVSLSCQENALSETPIVQTLTPGAAQQEDLQKQFREQVAQWKREKKLNASGSHLAQTKAYLRIIGLGPVVIPLLLAELEREPDHWFRALQALTGVDPVPPSSRGRMREMIAAWLRWGREQGYKW